jgi:hypothetical protein
MNIEQKRFLGFAEVENETFISSTQTLNLPNLNSPFSVFTIKWICK